MEGTSSDCGNDRDEDVGRLQEELQRAKERLRLWKAKTQVGVDELRNRIVKLTNERNSLQEALTQMKNDCERQHERGHVGTAAEPLVTLPSASTSSLLSELPGSIVHGMMQWIGATVDASSATLLKMSDEAFFVAASTLHELDKYRRSTTQMLRLQTKNIEALQGEISALEHNLSSAMEEIKERNNAIDSRDQALSVLQNRLEDLEVANGRLESLRVPVSNKLNAEQANMFEERLEEEVGNVRREFVSRENAIFEQHRDEIERLLAKHEEEMAELQAELEEKTLLAETAREDVFSSNEANGTAYVDVMREFKALQDELNVAQRENETLNKELQEMRGKLAEMNAAVAPTTTARMEKNSITHKNVSFTLPEAMARITELEGGMVRLSEELCEAKKRLIATKHQANSKESGHAHALEGEQTSYLKCIVIKLLCAGGGGSVEKNLFPVLSTLLRFDENDLKEVYKVHPSWVRRKF